MRTEPTLLDYHERSGLDPRRRAAVPDALDPATEPIPFRRYRGAELTLLDEVPLAGGPRYDDLFAPDAVPPAPLGRRLLSRLFYDSLALSGWKGSPAARYSLRVQPSAGNLHPLEAYLLTGPAEGVADRPGLFHYSPYDHGLERRAGLPEDLWSGGPLVGLTAIPWRSAWKYGERAYRLVHLDAGHAAAAISFAAAAAGWRARPVELEDAALAALLGVAGQRGHEAERPVLLLALTPGGEPPGLDLTLDAVAGLRRLLLAGEPSRVSPGARSWPALDAVLQEPGGSPGPSQLFLPPFPGQEDGRGPRSGGPARALLRRRRSRNRFDPGGPPLAAERFRHLLGRLGAAPHGLRIALFLHQVEGMRPGLHLLEEEGGLRLLHPGDCRAVAAAVACRQAAAGDGFFTAVFAVDLDALADPGAYRRLHWQAGALGHLLYLEAEAAGWAATGLSGFFDDILAQLLARSGRPLQALYLVAVGRRPEGPGDLLPVSPYAHRSEGASEPGPPSRGWRVS